MGKSLTLKQKRFIEEFPVDCNRTQAAIRAGYKPKSARFQGYKNLQKPEIFDAIMAKLAKKKQNAEYDAEKAEEEYEEVREAAFNAEEYSAAAAAIRGKCRIYGLDMTRTQIGRVDGGPVRAVITIQKNYGSPGNTGKHKLKL